VTHLRRMMLEELQRRHYSEATTQRYTPPHSYQIETTYRINNRGQYSAPQSISEACTLCCYPRPTRKRPIRWTLLQTTVPLVLGARWVYQTVFQVAESSLW
jgi:hypothetical protein